MLKSSSILEYTKAGYILIPLVGKQPITKKWVDTEYDPSITPEDFPENYGVVLQDTDLVIDVDPRNFPKRINSLTLLKKDIDDDLSSYTVKTGGGGLHIYFKKPKGLKIRRALNRYPGVEFKSKGQQVVGAGSIHPSTGMEYLPLYTNKKLDNIPNAPDKLLKLLDIGNQVTEAGIEEYLDDAQTCMRYIEYLLVSAPPAIEGQGGDNITFRVACKGKDFGLSPEKTLELMSKNWNEKCSPPWGLEELKIKVENAYAYSSSPTGNTHPTSDFEAVEQTKGWVLNSDKKTIKKTLYNAEM